MMFIKCFAIVSVFFSFASFCWTTDWFLAVYTWIADCMFLKNSVYVFTTVCFYFCLNVSEQRAIAEHSTVMFNQVVIVIDVMRPSRRNDEFLMN